MLRGLTPSARTQRSPETISVGNVLHRTPSKTTSGLNNSLPSSYRLQPSPSNVNPAQRLLGQLLECAKCSINIFWLTARTTIHDPQIHAPLLAILFIISARAKRLAAKRIRIAVPARICRRARSIKNEM